MASDEHQWYNIVPHHYGNWDQHLTSAEVEDLNYPKLPKKIRALTPGEGVIKYTSTTHPHNNQYNPCQRQFVHLVKGYQSRLVAVPERCSLNYPKLPNNSRGGMSFYK